MNETRTRKKYDQLIESCRALPPMPTAVAHPCDGSSLSAAIYEVTIVGKPPIKVFVSLYGESEIFAPVGFTTRGKTQAAAP